VPLCRLLTGANSPNHVSRSNFIGHERRREPKISPGHNGV
jgi:hypothetical protein